VSRQFSVTDAAAPTHRRPTTQYSWVAPMANDEAKCTVRGGRIELSKRVPVKPGGSPLGNLKARPPDEAASTG
jgi:hypothetical protein